ncbi:CRAL-TRIO domain containing protein [Oryctes borbonicus]|uniref:CRAL-TRIO domain containing protein n=1 Tax=Oryctes borbonicus TaxID=1629725 RepID=A0A0T6AX37_9SCAR|nr:CRAL-TRIO domain containing protein [Oryctes borbonicus]
MKTIAEYRELYKDTFYKLIPEQEKSSFVDNNVVNVLTNRDQHGRRILLVNGGEAWDTSKMTNDQLLRCLYLIHLGAILEPETQIHGVVIIFDLKGMGMSQVRQFTPSFAAKLISFIQEAMPLRFKGLHVVNNPFIWNIAWKILYPLQNMKIRERTHIHGSDYVGIHKYIHPNCLPQDWGGNLEKINYGSKDWYPCIVGYTNFVKKWNSYGKVKNK